ncbi:aspartate dehydrogenase [Candidatus Hydrogenedentota bacterium]
MTLPKIGIIGCGAISREVCRAVVSGEVRGVVAALADLDAERLDEIASLFEEKPVEICVDPENVEQGFRELYGQVDIIFEAAGGSIVPALLDLAISENKSLVVMSIGGLLGCDDKLQEAAEKDVRIVTPSGAIAGLDAVRAASVGGLESVTLTTRKPPAGLRGAPYLETQGIDVDSLDSETTIFEGNAYKAVEAFPKNVNVAAALSLAGIGPDKTKIKLVTSPEYTKNSHEVEAVGAFGRLTTRVENVPSPRNPKTSYLAALSAVAAMKEITGSS